jgi:4'-phosphopantetheinyl transferase
MSLSPLQLDWQQPAEFPQLGASEVHVWAVPLAVGDPSQETLAEAELERARNFALDKPRQSFVATRVALRSLLGRYLDLAPREVPIAFGPNGKPQLAAGDLHFNLAHSGDLALIAVTRQGPLGVDLEQLRPMTSAIELAQRNFHPRELAAIRDAADADRSRTFLRCWTRKEAVVKALAVGIGHPLDTFDVLREVAEVSTTSRGAQACYLHDLAPSAGYLAALATTSPDLAPLGFTYST